MGYWFRYEISPRSTLSEWREIKEVFEQELIEWDFEHVLQDSSKTIEGNCKNRPPQDTPEMERLSCLFPMTIFAMGTQGEEGERGSKMMCSGETQNKRFIGTLLRKAQMDYLKRKRAFGGVHAGIEHCVALMPNGKVAVDGINRWNQCDILGWQDIVQVDCGEMHTVGLCADGHVVACGSNANGQCDVETSGTKAIAISCGRYHTAILLEKGKVIVCGSTEENSESIKPEWTANMVVPIKYERRPKERELINKRIERISQGDPVQLKVNHERIVGGYASSVIEVFNSANEYLGVLGVEEIYLIEENLESMVTTAEEPLPVSLEEGRKYATLKVRIKPMKKTKRLEKVETLPVSQWPPMQKITAVYDAVVGMTQQGEIYVDGYQPFSISVLRELLI